MAENWQRNGKVRADDMENENSYTDIVQNQDRTKRPFRLKPKASGKRSFYSVKSDRREKA